MSKTGHSNIAVKFDTEKEMMQLLPPKFLKATAIVLTYGAKKYASWNYKFGKGLDRDRVYGAMLRHLNAWNDGEDIDPESGYSHLWHASCCIAMLIDLVESGLGKDTRFNSTDYKPNL